MTLNKGPSAGKVAGTRDSRKYTYIKGVYFNSNTIVKIGIFTRMLQLPISNSWNYCYDYLWKIDRFDYYRFGCGVKSY